MPVCLVTGDTSLPGLQITAFLLYPHMAFPPYVCMEREIEAVSSLVSLFIGTLILLDRGFTLMTLFEVIYFCKCPSPNTITLGFGASMYEFQKDTFQSIIPTLYQLFVLVEIDLSVDH